MIKIVYAASWLARRRFYSFSHELYKPCLQWKEPEVWQGKRVISARRNPLLKHPHAFLIAFEDGRMVARMLVGCMNGRGYFALFDAEENEAAVRQLLIEAVSWQKRQGIQTMIGPISPHPLDLGGGVLTEGFEEPAAFCDAYNAPYYDRLMIKAGAVPCEERLAYHVNRQRFHEIKYERASEWLRERFGYEVIDGLADTPRALTEAICQIMGDDTDREALARVIGAVQPYLLKEMCPVIYVDGSPVGYLLTIQERDGRARIVTMWVHEAWRRKGVTTLLFNEASRAMSRLGIEEIDASWVRADNKASVLSIENVGGTIAHRYKVYHFNI